MVWFADMMGWLVGWMDETSKSRSLIPVEVLIILGCNISTEGVIRISVW